MEKERRMSATEGDIDDKENRPRRRRQASKEDPGECSLKVETH